MSELRNRIYDYATEKPHVRVRALVHLRPKTQIIRKPVLWNNRQLKPSAREYFALTQVCRLMRQEYLQLYVARNEVCVTLGEMAEYLGVFLPASEAETFLETKAILAVDIHPASPGTSRDTRVHSALKPLILYACLLEHLHLRFVCDPNSEISEGVRQRLVWALDHLVFGKLYIWRHHNAQRLVSGVNLTFGGDEHVLWIEFGSDKVQFDPRYPRDAPVRVIEFLKELCMPPDLPFRVGVVVHGWRGAGNGTWTWYDHGYHQTCSPL